MKKVPKHNNRNKAFKRQVIMSEKEYIFKETYLPKTAKVKYDNSTSALERAKIIEKYSKNRYVKNNNSKPIKTITVINYKTK